jgi:hypothetical protein
LEEVAEIVDKEVLEKVTKNWDLFSLSQQTQLTKAILAVRNYQVTHPIESYKPHPKQKIFHCNSNKVRAIFGGNQSGKTFSGAKEVSFHFSGVYPDWYPKELRMKQPCRGRILVKDFPKGVGEVMEPALVKAIPMRFIKQAKRNSQGFLTKIVGHNGSTIDTVTHDMDTQSLEGWQGDWLWCDEPPPRDKWIASMRGLIRLGGRAWMTCTPLEEPWMYDDIYINPDYFSINIDIDDNTYLSKDEIRRFADMLNEDEKEARLHGKFMHLSGLTYKEFDPLIHLKDSLPEDSASWPKWQVVDPHTRKPFAIIYFAVDTIGRVWIYDEWPKDKFHQMRNSPMTPTDYGHLFSDMERNKVIYRRIMDGRFCKQPQGTGGDSLLEIFDSLGYRFEPSYITTTLSSVDPGYLKLKDRLKVSLITNEPDIFILKSCHNVIYSFQHNTWENFRDETKGVKEKQADFAKDFLDCIRYGLMDDPTYFISEKINTSGRSKWLEERLTQDSNQGSYGSMQEW